MECPTINLNNICRTCKNESPEMKSLFCRDSQSGKENPRLDEMLMACVSVQVNYEDGLPKSICRSCYVKLKNAYLFKEQCEKTDLFLRDYLINIIKKSIKEEINTDVEFTSNFISEINAPAKDVGDTKVDKRIENIKQDPDSQWGELRGKDVDYVQIVTNNFTIYECRTCSKVFYTLEDLRNHKRIHIDNIEQYYVKMEDDSITFSDQLDEGGGDDFVVVEDTMKTEVNVSENNDQEKADGRANEIYSEEDPLHMLMKTKIEEEVYTVCEGEAEADDSNEYDSDASTHSEYLPTKPAPPKMKRGRGRPRKRPASFKPNGKARGRPCLPKLKVKSPKNEMRNFPCPQCEEVFTNRTFLEKHAEQHDGLRIHECDACNKKFSKWNNLKRHKLLHVEVKPFLCMTCRKCFSRRDHLQQHIKLHLNMEIHYCDLCKAVFYRASNLAKHKASMHNSEERITEEEKNFLCAECGQMFSRNDDLVNHMKRHRGEKPFKCKFCGKGFTRTTDLTVHQRYHTGEKTHLCVTCGKGFGRAYNLTVHMRTHTGEKPYRCTYCEAAFAQGNDLKAHIRKHTGERFQCELCPKAFLIRYLLTQHKRVVHGLSIASNKRRLQPINKLNPNDPPPITVSDSLLSEQIEVSELKQEQ